MRAVYRKRLGDHGFDIINILIGFDAAEAQMQVCSSTCHCLSDKAVSLKSKNQTEVPVVQRVDRAVHWIQSSLLFTVVSSLHGFITNQENDQLPVDLCSSDGRALHWYLRGHGFSFFTGLNFFFRP